mgnify:CR=1 FL=1
MTPDTEKRQLGEYQLRELRGENTLCWTWLAEQVSVSRMVLVDELRTEESENSATFLANCRAKASVEHPLIGSVFEAVAEPGLCFYAHELLVGTTLAEWEKTGDAFDPCRLAVILRKVCDANLKHESLNRATSPLGLESIHLEQHGVIRLKNLAIAGVRYPSQSRRDVSHLGHSFVSLVDKKSSGAKRLLAVLGWMRGEGLDAPISWTQIRGYCIEIEGQLNDSSLVPSLNKQVSGKKNYPIAWIISGTALAMLGILAFALMTGRPTAPRSPLPGPVIISAGEYLTSDGATVVLAGFRISANEVTIGQYAEFLQAITNKGEKSSSETKILPQNKVSHLPNDWAALFTAAQKNGTWQNQAVTLDSPIVGVDWWDATAYAAWKGARLPSQEEWFAAFHLGDNNSSAIQIGEYLPVTSPKVDRTSIGLLGMGGSVSEWIGSPVQNPANPLGESVCLVAGGSYLKPSSNADSQEWSSDRSLRRKDLGFRIVFSE